MDSEFSYKFAASVFLSSTSAHAHASPQIGAHTPGPCNVRESVCAAWRRVTGFCVLLRCWMRQCWDSLPPNLLQTARSRLGQSSTTRSALTHSRWLPCLTSYTEIARCPSSELHLTPVTCSHLSYIFLSKIQGTNGDVIYIRFETEVAYGMCSSPNIAHRPIKHWTADVRSFSLSQPTVDIYTRLVLLFVSLRARTMGRRLCRLREKFLRHHPIA